MPSLQKLTVNGGFPLNGEVVLSGAKNEATKLMLASLLTAEECSLENCPDLGDTRLTQELIEAVGGKVSFSGNHVKLQTTEVKHFQVKELSRRNRIPILAIAPLLHRIGKVEVPLVGGDQLGSRPVNFHIESLQKMGARIEQRKTSYYAEAPQKLHGAMLNLAYPSVGATETVLLTGVLAKGKTILENAAIEPEIIDLIAVLNKMGAQISYQDRTIKIEGVEKLSGITHSIMPDRNEAVSFACLALATKGRIFVRHAQHEHLKSFLKALDNIGTSYEIQRDGMLFTSGNQALKPLHLEVDVHPGFMTDWQPPFAVLLTQAQGTSTIHDTVYEDRFGYTKILKSMGAHIEVSFSCLGGQASCRFAFRGLPHSAILQGPATLKSCDFEIIDIRAGIATVIAALAAQGTSHITGIDHIERGYENFFEKLQKLGAQIQLT